MAGSNARRPPTSRCHEPDRIIPGQPRGAGAPPAGPGKTDLPANRRPVRPLRLSGRADLSSRPPQNPISPQRPVQPAQSPSDPVRLYRRKKRHRQALRAGKLYPGFLPRNYGKFAHRDVCRWAGVDPASLPYPSHHYERFPDNGLSYRTNNFLKFAGIPATKAAVLKSLKNGDLTPTKRPLGYGMMTHAELCRWVGVTPQLLRKRKVASQ